jgi:hypothetical protein
MLTALFALALVIALGLYASRRLQRGYIDFLTPLLLLYAIHALTRAALLHYVPEWLDLNDRVAGAPSSAIVDALVLITVSLAALVACYLLVSALLPDGEPSLREIAPLSPEVAGALVAAGLVCRFLLRLNTEAVIRLPDWATTPVETFGWAVLAGVFAMAFACARRPRGARAGAAWLTAATIGAVLLVDARLSVSREATLQPILAAVLGASMGAGVPIRRIAATAAIIGLPLFLWIGAMKTYTDRGLGRGTGYLEALPRAREYSGLAWQQWIVGATQDRFHGLDSLVVTQSLVPAVIPYESGSLWTKVFVSAFVPRAMYPEKQVGWGFRFASEFWGLAPEAEGRVAVGISHLGTLYVYGGTWSCIGGMAVLGVALALLAAQLRTRQTIAGPMLFVLTAFTLCQVDRDLEVVLGGVLKQLVLFGAVLPLLPLRRVDLRCSAT